MDKDLFTIMISVISGLFGGAGSHAALYKWQIGRLFKNFDDLDAKQLEELKHAIELSARVSSLEREHNSMSRLLQEVKTEITKHAGDVNRIDSKFEKEVSLIESELAEVKRLVNGEGDIAQRLKNIEKALLKIVGD